MNALNEKAPREGGASVEYANASGKPTIKQDKDSKKSAFEQFQVAQNEEFTKIVESLAKVVPESGWRRYKLDRNKRPAPVPPILSIDGQPVLQRGGTTCISGGAKAGKSTLIASICAALVGNTPVLGITKELPVEDAVLFDTEMSENEIWGFLDIITKISGCGETWDNALKLDELAPEERLQQIVDYIAEIRPGVALIDGVADLLNDPNDLRESKALVAELNRIAHEYQTAILAVLHTNPGTDKSRGHLGSEIDRKFQTCILIEKNESGEFARVTPRLTRKKPFREFAFRLNSEGLPELCTAPEITHKSKK